MLEQRLLDAPSRNQGKVLLAKPNVVTFGMCTLALLGDTLAKTTHGGAFY